MKNILFALAAATMLVGLNFIAFAQKNDDPVRKELEAVYGKIDTAIKAKDSKTLESLLDKDYEGHSDGKKKTKDDAVAEMKEAFQMIKEITSAKTTVDKIQQVEGNEIVDYTQTVKGTITGEDGKEHSLEGVQKGRDWWVKGENGKWICVAGEEISSEVKIDGKPVK